MGDTIYNNIPDSIQRILDSLDVDVTKIGTAEEHSNPSETGSLLFMVLVVMAVVLAKIVYEIYKTRKNINSGESVSFIQNESSQDFYFYSGHQLGLSDADIVAILKKYFSYYSNLSTALQLKFLERLKLFMSIKTFIIPKDETFKEIPVLLSAAATQLTFGLDEYELTWFKNIHVNAEEYFANDPHALRVLAGNVEGNTVTVAWNQFLKGIKDANDGVNVGLHELAHALYYQHVIADNGNEKEFIKELGIVMQEGGEVYEQKKASQALFSDYAYKNMQEFWAESIEIFFERPTAMQSEFPDLYNSIKDLLNQDPINKLNPLLQN